MNKETVQRSEVRWDLSSTYPEYSLHWESVGYRLDQESDIRGVFTGLFAALRLRRQHEKHVHGT